MDPWPPRFPVEKVSAQTIARVIARARESAAVRTGAQGGVDRAAGAKQSVPGDPPAPAHKKARWIEWAAVAATLLFGVPPLVSLLRERGAGEAHVGTPKPPKSLTKRVTVAGESAQPPVSNPPLPPVAPQPAPKQPDPPSGGATSASGPVVPPNGSPPEAAGTESPRGKEDRPPAAAVESPTNRPGGDSELKKCLARKISFEFVDLPLDAALSVLGEKSGARILLDPRATAGGMPSINLKISEMDAETALKWVLQLGQLNYQLKDGAVWVVGNQHPDPEAAAQPGAPSSLTAEVLKERLARKISFEFVQTPFAEALAFLSDSTKIPLLLDPRATVEGVPALSLKVSELDAATALQRVLRLAGMRYEERGGTLVVGTLGSGAVRMETRTYDLKEVAAKGLDAASILARARQFAPASWATRKGAAAELKSDQLVLTQGEDVHAAFKAWLQQYLDPDGKGIPAPRPVPSSKNGNPKDPPADGAFGHRVGEKPASAVSTHGGSQATERGIDAALQWLAYHQEADGHWDPVKFSSGQKTDTACTGLGLLAYLSAGHTEKVGKYKENVRRAVEWLKSRQQEQGLLFEFSDAGGHRGIGYPHAIAGLALCEAAGMARVQATIEAAQKAVDYSTEILQQGEGDEKGAWRYAAKSIPDLSVSGWYILQLKSAKIAGLRVNPASFAGAIKFLDSVEVKRIDPGDPAGHRYAYQPGTGPTHRVTAIGCFCRQLLGYRRADLQGGIAWALQKGGVPHWNARGGDVDLYYWHWATLCAFQQGGEVWKRWNEALKKTLLENQRKGGDEDGSWDPVGAYSGEWGRVGQTALAALCLEVYYRYLPLYKADDNPQAAEPPKEIVKEAATEF